MAIERRHNIPDLNSPIAHHEERDDRVARRIVDEQGANIPTADPRREHNQLENEQVPRRRVNRRRRNIPPINPPRIQDEKELELESEFFFTLKKYKKPLFNRYKRYGLLNFPGWGKNPDPSKTNDEKSTQEYNVVAMQATPNTEVMPNDICWCGFPTCRTICPPAVLSNT
ncbi:hypothetical protein TKK_0018786 [Trichogramma kaykai]